MSSSDAAADEAATVESDDLRDGVVARLADLLGDDLLATHVDPGVDMWARVTTDSWVRAGEGLRYVLGARSFGFLSAIDWMPSPFGRSMDAAVDLGIAPSEGAAEADGPEAVDAGWETGVCGGDTRFQIIARVANIADGWGITLKTDVADDDPRIASWVRVYAGADWHEREAWEMFGIHFDGHPALRNIYLPTGFEGNPLRKDFPLVARMVKPWPGIVDTEPMPDVASSDSPAGSLEASGSTEEVGA